MRGQLRNGPDDLPESAEMTEQGADGNQGAAEHQARLNHIRPDDGLDAADRRIQAGDDREGDDRGQIGTDRGDGLLAELHLPARCEHAVGHDHHQRRDEEPRARGQGPHEEKEGRDEALGPWSEAHAQVVVDRVDLERVVGLEEDVADHESPDDEAEDELHIGEALVGVPLARRAEEGRRARFGGDDGGHDGPPRHAPPAERKVVESLLPPSHIQSDGRNGDEVKEDDTSVDQKPPVRPHPPSPAPSTARPPMARGVGGAPSRRWKGSPVRGSRPGSGAAPMARRVTPQIEGRGVTSRRRAVESSWPPSRSGRPLK